ncbi:glycosyltransferase [Vibrio metschnikovii]
MSSPKVSVVMSVYNGEKYLEEAIQSILDQTFTDFEFIIINDGSIDKTLEIIQSYINKDNRIVLISRENKGLITSLNEGLNLAKGQYIARMDADDVSLPDRLSEQVKVMEEKKEVIICGTWIRKLYEDGNTELSKYYVNDSAIKAKLVRACCFAHPTVMLRADIFKKNLLFYEQEYLHAEDYALWAKASSYGNFYNIPKVLLNYRVLNNSITRLADKNETQRIDVYKKIQKIIFDKLTIPTSELNIETMISIYRREKIAVSDINFKCLFSLFDKIISANENSGYCDSLVLKEVLGDRVLLCFLVKKSPKIIFSKYLFYGILGYLKKHIS